MNYDVEKDSMVEKMSESVDWAAIRRAEALWKEYLVGKNLPEVEKPVIKPPPQAKYIFSPADYELGGAPGSDREKYIIGALVFWRFSYHLLKSHFERIGEGALKTPTLASILTAFGELIPLERPVDLESLKWRLKWTKNEAELWGILAECEQVYIRDRNKGVS